MNLKTHEVEEFVKNLFVVDLSTRHETINKIFSKQLLSLPTDKLAMVRRK